MTGRASSVQGLRWVQALLLSLMWATMDIAAALAERSDFGHSSLAAKGGGNIDTGTAIAFVSEGSAVRHQLKAFVAGKEMQMTETALGEFQGALRSAGPLEAARGQRFLNRVSIIPDNPSARAMGLTITKKVGADDRIIFGAGDNLSIPTMTSDAKFLRGASAQGSTLMRSFTVRSHSQVSNHEQSRTSSFGNHSGIGPAGLPAGSPSRRVFTPPFRAL